MIKQKQKLKIEQIRTFKLKAIRSYEFESSYLFNLEYMFD